VTQLTVTRSSCPSLFFYDLAAASSWTDLIGGWRTSHRTVLAATRDAMWYWPGIQLHANSIRVDGWATSHSCDRRPAAGGWSLHGQAALTVGDIQWLPVAAGERCVRVSTFAKHRNVHLLYLSASLHAFYTSPP